MYVVFPKECNKLSTLGAIVLSFGALQLLAQLARDRGKKIEFKLFEQWGGIPSERILCHSNSSISLVEKEKIHRTLAHKTGTLGPSILEEKINPEGAKSIYKLWSNYLRSATRDSKRYHLVQRQL
jgi:hypothetical protein